MHIGDWIGRGALYFPEYPAVVDVARGPAGSFTYRQLDRRATRLAGWLSARGVGRGERVGLLAHNGVEYLDAFFACGKLGAILVPYNWRLHQRELQELIDDTAPAVLLHADEFQQQAAGLREFCPSLQHEVRMSDLESLLVAPGDPPPLPAAEVREEDIACLLFTGGTTGTSKGAMISHRMIAWNTLAVTLHELQRGDVTITHTPMFHTGGLLVYTLPVLVLGGTVVIMRRWDPDEMLDLLGRERVTAFFCVPTQYQQLLSSPRFAGADFSSVRFMTSGGAPLPVSLVHEFQRVHKTPFKQGFGMTEFGPGVFSMGPEYAISKAGSIGRANYFVEARIVDDEGRDVAQGTAGELWLRCPACFSGYFGNATATRAAIDPGGWFHTGDVARVDMEGFYYIVDRKKDMFISGGENVYPVEIERALYEHPVVFQCAVIGVPDERWGQVGKAFVVLRPGAAATAEELLDFLRDRLARYKVPKAVAFLSAMPLSPAGKILKRELAGV